MLGDFCGNVPEGSRPLLQKWRSRARRYVMHHLGICCCCTLKLFELEVRETAWAGQWQRVLSAANSRQWWRCVPVRVTSSCQTANSRWQRSRIRSGAPGRCRARHCLHITIKYFQFVHHQTYFNIHTQNLWNLFYFGLQSIIVHILTVEA